MASTTALAGFHPATREWFARAFATPTPAQVAAWEAIRSGRHALVIAPTGSGKTLAAFLHSIDALLHEPDEAPPARRGVQVLYVSPLKALAVDVERNLTVPLAGIARVLAERGHVAPDITVAVRSGDTPASQRRSLIAHPPDILITTPESLFLMLSSQAAATLADVRTLIVDEVHAVAGTKRGAHLALSLERLDALNRHGGVQRLGLSATVRPPEAVARFLGGASRPVDVLAPPAAKTWRLAITVPVPDMTDLGRPASPGDPSPSWSMWPPIEEAVLDQILAHRSTICFVNSRGVAERLTAHLNERYAGRLGAAVPEPAALPSVYTSTANTAKGADGTACPVIARAHHGSMSKARRAEIEADLKAGRLPCVVATSSLELGIDMGAVDLVIQVGAPPSVASGLQRIGRAGHQVGAISQGVLYPIARSDLLESAVVVERMRAGQIEPVAALRNPLDVLAQHLVSACLDASPTATGLYDLVRRADGFADLPRPAFDAVLDMLTGRYPSEAFAELRPRLVWDRASDRLSARPGARHLVTTSGGTIPDRGLYGVFVAGPPDEPAPAAGRQAAPRRVGELDEEMVFESRLGDVITLGSSAWRIEAITPHQVRVSPAPGQAGRLPFWHGDSPSRPAELGAALGDFVDALARPPDEAVRARLDALGLDPQAGDNLRAYVADQVRATGVLPDAATIVVERFRDELGDWRVCVHCPLGLGVLRPWLLAAQPRLAQRWGVDVRAIVRNDGIVLRFPDTDGPPPGADLLALEPDRIEAAVAAELAGSALFAARFRECAARALLLPRREPGRRSPLWQQRLRSAQLLSVAAGFPDFPIIAEAMRECLEDVFDLPALRRLLTDIAARRVRLVEVETARPSPFAVALQFGYTGEFLYDPDQPLAERAAVAASFDSGLLAHLLGHASRDALEPDVVAAVEADLQQLSPARAAKTPEQLWDLLRRIGPLGREECRARCAGPDADAWLTTLSKERRVIAAEVGGQTMWAADLDADLLAGLGPGPPSPAVEERLVERWLDHHLLVRPSDLADRYGWPQERVRARLDALVAADRARRGRFLDAAPEAYVGAAVLTLVRRRTAAWLRSRVRPVPQRRFAGFLPVWQELDPAQAGEAVLPRAIELLAGVPLPASMLEALILPARVPGYAPAMLDELLGTGEVVWTGAGALGEHDGWVRLWPADLAIPTPEEAIGPAARHLLERLRPGGAWRAQDLADDVCDRLEVEGAIWELVWAGWLTSDSLAPLRALSRHGGGRRPAPPRPRRAVLTRLPRPPLTPAATGRWSVLPPDASPDASATRRLGLQLGRYGVLTRGSLVAEPGSPGFAAAYPALAGLAERGVVQRGHFVEGLGAAQFALPGAVEALRDHAGGRVRLLAACDPANAWGAALPWPASDGPRPTRQAGALVVLDDGDPVCYLERGAHTLVTFGHPDPERLTAALACLGAGIDDRSVEEITIRRINDRPALEAPAATGALLGAGFRMVPQGFARRPARDR